MPLPLEIALWVVTLVLVGFAAIAWAAVFLLWREVFTLLRDRGCR